jgi:hypothetical protein
MRDPNIGVSHSHSEPRPIESHQTLGASAPAGAAPKPPPLTYKANFDAVLAKSDLEGIT